MAVTITETRGHVAEMTPNSHFSVPVTMDRNGRSRSPKYAAASDKTVEATKRLFYVTASRAKESLALVAYSSAPERIKSFVLDQGWFDGEEVVMDVQRQ